MTDRRIIAVTCGDIAGIGPEVVVKAISASEIRDEIDCVVVGHPAIVQAAVDCYSPGCQLHVLPEPTQVETLRAAFANARQQSVQTGKACVVCIDDPNTAVPEAARCEVSAEAGDAAFRSLNIAIRLAQAHLVDGIATAPLNKEALHLAGHMFPGHTEILADRCGVTDFAMMLHLPESQLEQTRSLIRNSSEQQQWKTAAAHGISVAHVTLHTSIASVPSQLSIQSVYQKTDLMHGFLKSIGCERAAIGVAALNPHGGENGLFGDEESSVISPAVIRAQRSGINARGPLPIDTLIRRAFVGEFDGVVAMYHDQGHIPIKLLGFDSALNITLGLPIIRTSPTHGTAFDKAWKQDGVANASGMIEAIRMAACLKNV